MTKQLKRLVTLELDEKHYHSGSGPTRSEALTLRDLERAVGRLSIWALNGYDSVHIRNSELAGEPLQLRAIYSTLASPGKIYVIEAHLDLTTRKFTFHS